jgi:hypothetical protein
VSVDPGRREWQELGGRFLGMLRRDFLWVACCLFLFFLLLVALNRAAEKENACFERFRPFVESCYESHGLVPTGVNYSYNLSILQRTDGERWING